MSTVVPEPDKRPITNIVSPTNSERSLISEDNDEPVVIHVGAFAFMRTMWSLFWTAFRHPMTTTEIDVATGAVLDPCEEGI